MAGVGMLGIDQGESDEVTAVLGPGLKQGDTGEPGRRLCAFGDGTALDTLHTDAERLGDQVAVLPQPTGRHRGQILGNLYELLDELLRAQPKGQVDPSGRAKEIGDTGEIGTLDVGKKQSRPAGSDHAAVDFGDLEIGIDGGFDGDEFPFAAKEIEELTQVLHGRADRFLVVYFQGFISLAPLPCISTTLRVTRVRS